MAEKKQIKIVQMGKFFLYLPLYYAVECNFFGYLPEGFEVTVVLPQQRKDRTDKGVLKCLMDTASEENAGVQYAVCDPTSILAWPLHKTPAPTLLAGMVTNAAFWAIDRGSREVNFPADLANFDAIIAYDEGSTSYGIARRVYLEAGKTPQIVSVEPPDELVRLGESALGTIALSPDPLGIEDFLVRRKLDGFDIDLALGKTQEYNNVLVTALIGRTDFVLAKENELITLGIIRGLQRAMALVRFADAKVVEFAHNYFERKPQERILRALQMARDSQVFPSSVEVSEAHWSNAAKAHCFSHGNEYDNASRMKAQEVFATLAAPYTHWATRAVEVEVLNRFRVEVPSKQEKNLWLVIPLILILLATGFVAGDLLHDNQGWLVAGIATLGLAIATVVPRVIRRNPKCAAGAFYGLVWIFAIALSIAWHYKFHVWDFATSILGITSIYLGAIGILAFAPKADKPGVTGR
ncbi:MAG: hypothetical protein LAO24_08975 [Acidobacteriia bacterium]|nr:hypothetical protein [Terriglobia bacterium]